MVLFEATSSWEGFEFERAKGRKELKLESFDSLSSKSSPLCLENWIDKLPHMNAITIARKVGTTGVVMSPMAACATG